MTPQQENAVFECPENLDIASVSALHGVLCDWLNEHASLALDAGNVEKVDTAGIQLLCSLFVSAQKTPLKLTWQCVSTLIWDTAQRLDVTALLNLTADMIQDKPVGSEKT